MHACCLNHETGTVRLFNKAPQAHPDFLPAGYGEDAFGRPRSVPGRQPAILYIATHIFGDLSSPPHVSLYQETYQDMMLARTASTSSLETQVVPCLIITSLGN